MTCPHCEADLVESGVVVRIEEDRLYMRQAFGTELALVGTLTTPAPKRVQCRACLQVLQMTVVETLRISV